MSKSKKSSQLIPSPVVKGNQVRGGPENIEMTVTDIAQD